MIEMNTPIWRYLSFFKFFDWVASRKMYFARADQFKDDRWECVIPDVILLKRLELLKESGFDAERIHRIRNQYDVTNPLRRSHSFVSSWFRAENESDLMWRANCGQHPGIAVKSTPQLIKESLADDQQHSAFVKVDEVAYYNPDAVGADLDLMEKMLCAPILSKRDAFAGDQECRFFIEWNEIQTKGDEAWVATPEKCLRVECNTKACFNEIVLSPGVEKSSLEVIKDFVEGYGIDPAVVRLSKIDEQFDQLIDRNALQN